MGFFQDIGNSFKRAGPLGPATVLTDLTSDAFKNSGFGNDLLSQFGLGRKDGGSPEALGIAATPAIPQVPAGPSWEEVKADAEKRQSELLKRLEDLYAKAFAGGTQQIEQSFIPQRERAVAEEAALGRLRSPASIVNLSRLDERKNNAISGLSGQLAGQRANSEIDLSKTLQGLIESEKNRGQNRDQMNVDINKFNSALGQKDQEISLAERLGVLQAKSAKEAKEPGALDYANTGANLLGTVAKFAPFFA